VLQAEKITVPHPSNPAKNIVSDISFELRKGEVLGIAGLVGAGRSELVNAIFGKIKMASGTVKVHGKETEISHPSSAIAAGIALVTEDRKSDGYVNLMTIRENIALANMKKVSRWGHILQEREKESTGEHFRRLRIKAPDMNRRLLTLSGGNQQKVVLSKWLMTNPEVLLLDEPTRGIDVGSKREIYTIMNELAAAGIAIIMISSELPELLSMSDRILVLSGGRVSTILEKEQFSQETIMDYATRFLEEARSCT
jgi:ABC-type sugar transport system ATPase subunit